MNNLIFFLISGDLDGRKYNIVDLYPFFVTWIVNIFVHHFCLLYGIFHYMEILPFYVSRPVNLPL